MVYLRCGLKTHALWLAYKSVMESSTAYTPESLRRLQPIFVIRCVSNRHARLVDARRWRSGDVRVTWHDVMNTKSEQDVGSGGGDELPRQMRRLVERAEGHRSLTTCRSPRRAGTRRHVRYDTIRYGTLWYIYVRSKADATASLI